jgi:hypothetical protein
MNKDEIMQRIEIIEAELNDLRSELDKPDEVEPKPLFVERKADYTLDEIHDIVSERNPCAEFQLRAGGEYALNGIFLGLSFHGCAWEIVKDRNDAWVLILKDNK